MQLLWSSERFSNILLIAKGVSCLDFCHSSEETKFRIISVPRFDNSLIGLSCVWGSGSRGLFWAILSELETT